MSPALNGSSMLERFEHSNASEIHNGIMFDFYPGLPHLSIFTMSNSTLSNSTSKLFASVYYSAGNLNVMVN